MSGIVLTEVADATIPTPAAGKVTVYMSVEEAGPAYKDDAAAVTPLQGAAGGTGATGPGYGGTSTTSFAIGTGSKAFTTQAGRAYVAGSRVRAASDADPDADWMEGVCSAYSGTTLTVLIDLTSGSGTHTDWNLSLAGEAPAAWLGAWSGATAYTEGDAVSNDGSSYVCILGHTNQEPPNVTYWDVLAQGAGSDLDAIITASSGQDIADALAGAAAPDAGNVFATIADVGAGGGVPFKYTVRSGNGDYTSTSTTRTPIDATNLAYLTLTLAVGDVVRCTLNATCGVSTGLGSFDFEVDQPTSGNVDIGAGLDAGLGSSRGDNAETVHIVGMFVATEAGAHGFRPTYFVESGFTVRLRNATSGTSENAIMFSVEKLGTPVP